MVGAKWIQIHKRTEKMKIYVMQLKKDSLVKVKGVHKMALIFTNCSLTRQ